MIEIRNNTLKVDINEKGAELAHLIDIKSGFDYIWGGSEWPKHAPILFPSIGRSVDDSYLLDGQTYPMQQHGFAADYDFELLEQTADKVILAFKGNLETKKSYPFDFELRVTYQLIENNLVVGFEVKNTDARELAFALGFHPAFNLPNAFDSYRLEMSPEQALTKFDIVKNPFPYRSGSQERLTENSSLKLSRPLFEKGLVILNNDIDRIFVHSEQSDYALTMELADFLYLCLWTKEDAELAYLCIEPFQGLPDIVDRPAELLKKEGNVRLAPGESRSYRCKLTLGDSN